MGKLTANKKADIWAEVCEEFPGDEVMQEIHFIRQVHYFSMKDIWLAEFLSFF